MMSGMNIKPGDLVGIPFPYSNLKAEKRRPVLVLTQADRHDDFICAAVTSVPTAECAVAIDNSSMTTGNMPRQSWVRCDKIFTLSKSVIVRQYGSLRNEPLNNVREKYVPISAVNRTPLPQRSDPIPSFEPRRSFSSQSFRQQRNREPESRNKSCAYANWSS